MTGYLWVKAFHLIFIVTWFAGLFYLPRLFAYHVAAEDQVSRERFKVMERKLLRIIMNPSMIVTLVLGLWLLIGNWERLGTAGWVHAKLTLLVFLFGYHMYCARIRRKLANDEEPHTERFLRIFNEVPAVLLILIVLLAVLKPF